HIFAHSLIYQSIAHPARHSPAANDLSHPSRPRKATTPSNMDQNSAAPRATDEDTEWSFSDASEHEASSKLLRDALPTELQSSSLQQERDGYMPTPMPSPRPTARVLDIESKPLLRPSWSGAMNYGTFPSPDSEPESMRRDDTPMEIDDIPPLSLSPSFSETDTHRYSSHGLLDTCSGSNDDVLPSPPLDDCEDPYELAIKRKAKYMIAPTLLRNVRAASSSMCKRSYCQMSTDQESENRPALKLRSTYSPFLVTMFRRMQCKAR
ncbi:hypothetical protein P280DRAFT_525502, partial [Massarina eburnea CBS 473.64]